MNAIHSIKSFYGVISLVETIRIDHSQQQLHFDNAVNILFAVYIKFNQILNDFVTHKSKFLLITASLTSIHMSCLQGSSQLLRRLTKFNACTDVKVKLQMNLTSLKHVIVKP